MKKAKIEKMESLLKYVPFIDFLLTIDKQKYIKFTNIRKWIVLKGKEYTLNVLNKIEKSIITQYQNLLIEDKVRIPQSITNIFAPLKLQLEYVNLCSDDDDDNDEEEQNKTINKSAKVTEKNHSNKENETNSKRNDNSRSTNKTNSCTTNNTKPSSTADDSDDDLEIISIDYIEKPKELRKFPTSSNISKVVVPEDDDVLGDVTRELLRKIDKLEEEECKSKARHEPNNYCYQQNDAIVATTSINNTAGLDNGISEDPCELFERRQNFKNESVELEESVELFTRRTDFKTENEHKEAAVIEKEETAVKTDTLPKNSAEIKNDDEVVVNSLVEENHINPHSNKTIEIISLDSGSEDESYNDKPSTSKAAVAALKAQTNADKQTHLPEITNSAAKKNAEASPDAENCIISREKFENLCDTIESTFSEQINFNELLDEIQSNPSNEEVEANKNDCSDDLMAISNKENHNIQPAKEISSQSIKNTQEFSKRMQIDLNNIDFEQLSIAVSHLNNDRVGNNASNANSSESPPPPAPSIPRNVTTTPPLNTPLQLQQPQQQTAHMMYPNVVGQPPFQSFCHVPYMPMPAHQLITPPYTPIQNAPQVLPPRPRVNIKDPRIQKQLQTIQKSPLISCNLINSLVADSIMNICRSNADQQLPKPPQQQQNILSKKTSAEGVVVRNRTKSASETTVSAISYGEYKRRKLEKELQAERLREEEKAAKLEKLKADEVRSKIILTLKPCKDQITSLWSRHKSVVTNTTHHIDSDSEVEDEAVLRNGENFVEKSNATNVTAIETQIEPQFSNNSENKTISPTESKKKKKRGKRRRLDLNLSCTVKGFDQVECFQTLKERRSSIQAREHIRQQLNVDHFEDTLSETNFLVDMPQTVSPESRFSATAPDQPLDSQPKEINNDHLQPIGSKRRFSQFTGIDSSFDFTGNNSCTSAPTHKRRKTIDDINKPTRRRSILRIEDSSSDSDSDGDEEKLEKLKKLKEAVVKNPGYVKLERISREFIRKHTKRKPRESTPNLLDVHLVEFTSNNSENLKKTEESNSRKTKLLPKFNNDCQMTERNTRFCVLCTSKPSDLTSHYVRKHKTESYVARLDWSELDDLTINTPFAKPQTVCNGRSINRYAVTCPFCKEEIVDTFMNLYNHYASHTGEFAYQCGHCNLLKPYRADIQSHILHAKACRNTQVQIIYRYPPAAQCIYLHYCNICNFVQLNEANITKHIREHHPSTKAVAANVGKCILAAMSDVPAENNTADKALSPQPSSSSSANTQQKQTNTNVVPLKTKPELNFKVEDDDVPVSNEPCTEEIFEENKTSPEEQLKQMHEDPPPNAQEPPPMTVIHYTENLRTDSTEFDHVRTQPTNGAPITPQTVLPMSVKVEQLEINEQQIQIPTRPALNTVSLIQHTHSMANSQPASYATYEKYRCYPETVNYLGLYKCMIDDCYYSTDSAEEFLKHLSDHALDTTTTNEYLQCPYCIIPVTSGGSSLTAQELVEHVHREHQHMIYQCSICCYRSCEGSNVLIHQKSHHSNDLKVCKIFKCIAHLESSSRQQGQMDLNELIKKNVYKVSCSICQLSFYNSNLLVRHLSSVHNISDASLLKIYSCIYCPLTDNDINHLRLHVASKHPGEIPQLYDRNGQVHKTEDCLTSLNVINLSESVPCIEVAPVVNENMDANVQHDPKDIKPDLEQLQQMNEETIKVRLRKLTNHTGIAPDTLYRCPIATCGGFFSVYDLWLKHMKLRHCALECECPHCPDEPAEAATMLSLDSFRLHFEKHRRHTFVCFYCKFTCSNEQAAREHGLQEHSSFGQMRFEKIRFNINYSYSIMLQNSLFPQREDFINELLVILEKRLIDMEAMEKQKLKHQWPLNSNVVWLEDFPKVLANRNVNLRCLIKTCNYRSPNEMILFEHVNNTHQVSRTAFNCSTCSYRLEPFTLKGFYNHMKTHTTSSFICTACSLQTSSRSKLSAHIRDQHAARDVAVVHLYTVEQEIYHKIYIIFANDCLTFSTMKNCFCCTESNMSGNAFSLHLKRYHNLVLDYYCEGCTNFLFKSLKEVKAHFEEFHKEERIKIRCELSAQMDLSVLALNEFQVQISNAPRTHQQVYKPLQVNIKDEPYDSSDDCVILLEDDDIAIEKSLKDKANTQEKPQLKCKSFNNLIAANDNNHNNNVVPQTNGTMQQILERNQVRLTPLNGFNGQNSYNGHHYNNLLTTSAFNTYNVVANPIYNVCSSNTTTIPTLSNHNLPVVTPDITSNGIVNSTCSDINQTSVIQQANCNPNPNLYNTFNSAFNSQIQQSNNILNNRQYIQQNFINL